MKIRIIYFNIFIFSVFCLQAQNYESFFGDNETIITRLSNNSTLGEHPYMMDSLAITAEVLTANNNTLKVVEYYRTNQEPFEDSELIFYLRENLDEGKLWFRNTIEGDEFLIADLSLTIGDSPDDIIGVGNQTVSEVNFDDGQKFIRFDQPIFVAPSDGLSNQFMFLKEGVFPNFLNLFGDYPMSTLLSITTCIIKDGVQVFSIDDVWVIDLENPYTRWVACEQVDLYENFSNEDFNSTQFSIYPNPTTNLLHIESGEVEIQRIEVFNLTGKRVLQINANNSEIIEVGHLDRGLYLLKIQTTSGSVVKKFVKE